MKVPADGTLKHQCS